MKRSSKGGRRRRQPERTCVVCRQKRPKEELVRWYIAEGGLASDPTGKGPGRGAYACADTACADPDSMVRRLEHALRTRLTPSDVALVASWRNSAASDVKKGDVAAPDEMSDGDVAASENEPEGDE